MSMMKQLRFAFLSMLMLFCGTAMAEDVTINFDDDYATLFPTLPGVSCAANADAGVEASTDGDFTETLTSTAVGGVTVTVSVADEGKTTPNRIWNASPRLRMYSGTFTVKGTDITKIVFNAPSKFNMTASVGAIDGKTWTGDKTNEVVFTVGGNTQMKSITVTLGEGGEVTPPTPTVEQITVAKALEIIDALEDGKTTTESYQVKGFIVGAPDFQRKADGSLFGNVNLTIADEKGGTALLTVYRGKDLENKNFTEETISRIKEGDEVVFQGKLQKYVKDEVVTPELKDGYLISVNAGETPETVEAPEFNPNGGEFEESIEVTLTCATEGATIYYAVADAPNLEWQEYTAPITLTETTILAAKAKKGDVESEMVRAQFTKKETPEPVGETVVFNFDDDYATLFPTLTGVSSGSGENYVADGDFQGETTSTAISGVTVTVSPDEDAKTPSRIWGTAPRLRMYSGTFTVSGKDIVKIEFTSNSNFSISTKTGTLDGKTWTGKADEVVFDVTKNTQINKIVVTLEGPATAIQTISASADNAPVYNLAGQRVMKAQKGLFIQNGKKFMVK